MTNQWYENCIACPLCKENMKIQVGSYSCDSCSKDYPLVDGIPVLIPNPESVPDPEDRSPFWNEGWKRQLKSDGLKDFGEATGDQIRARVENDWEPLRDTLYTVEANRDAVLGKVVLDIGCGAGSQGPIFETYGARYIGLDFSYQAARQTDKYIHRMGGQGVGINGRAEYLPIKSESVDFVFSHGVLHHTPNTQETFDEVYRCLKPGGMAAIGLYVTYSPAWMGQRVRGWLAKLKSENTNAKAWYHLTEGGWLTGEHVNPWTKTYTKKELSRMFFKAGFKDMSFRKSVMEFGHWMPFFGKYIDQSHTLKPLRLKLASKLGGMWSITLKK